MAQFDRTSDPLVEALATLSLPGGVLNFEPVDEGVVKWGCGHHLGSFTLEGATRAGKEGIGICGQ